MRGSNASKSKVRDEHQDLQCRILEAIAGDRAKSIRDIQFCLPFGSHNAGEGDLYAMLRGLEAKGWIRSRSKRVGVSTERVYEITERGHQHLSDPAPTLEHLTDPAPTFEPARTAGIDDRSKTTSTVPSLGATLVDQIRSRNRIVQEARRDALARAHDAISELNRLGYFCKLTKRSKPPK